MATMTKARASELTYETILLADSSSETQFQSLRRLDKSQIQQSLCSADKDTIWIGEDRSTVVELVKSAKGHFNKLGGLLLMFKPIIEDIPTLSGFFDRIAFSANGILSAEELTEVLSVKNRSDLFIGGVVDLASETITLWRGDLTTLTVPFSAFPPSGDGISPDFHDFSVIDYGNTVRFGEYEASSDAILYEHDAKYRRRKKRELVKSEKGLGPSIRRLRKQRGLRREDFDPLDPKTIARIEQGKVKSVQKKTLKTIADRLKTTPEELSDY